MILWSSQKLEEALARGELSSWTKVKYLILPAILSSLNWPFYLISPTYGEKPPVFTRLIMLVFSVLTAYITYRGIKSCFQANEGIDGKLFFERFAVLFVPSFVRIMVATFFGSILLLAIIGLNRERFLFLFQGVSIIFAAFGPIITYALYAMIQGSFKRFGKLQKQRGSNLKNSF